MGGQLPYCTSSCYSGQWIGKKQRKHRSAPTERITELSSKGYLIPFTLAVTQFLSIRIVHEAVLDSFEKYSKEPNGRYYEVSDGEVCRGNPVFMKQNVLVFQIYSDEVELADPLGRKKGKHKVVLFYWSLLNLPHQWRSKLKSNSSESQMQNC